MGETEKIDSRPSSFSCIYQTIHIPFVPLKHAFLSSNIRSKVGGHQKFSFWSRYSNSTNKEEERKRL